MNFSSSSFYDHITPWIRQEIGKQVRTAREEMGWSQAELAEALDRRQAYISEIERGKTEPNSTTLISLAMVLKKPLLYFIPSDYRDPSQRQVSPAELSPEENEIIKRLREMEAKGGFNYRQALYMLNAMVNYEDKLFMEEFEED